MSMLDRLGRALRYPVVVVARLFPVRCARWIGVHIGRAVTGYGSSYPMFSAEPDLVSLGDNVFIGTKAVIMKGVTIGEGSIVGAFAVVTKDVPSGSTVAGNPALVVKTTAECLQDAEVKSLRIGYLTGRKKGPLK